MIIQQLANSYEIEAKSYTNFPGDPCDTVLPRLIDNRFLRTLMRKFVLLLGGSLSSELGQRGFLMMDVLKSCRAVLKSAVKTTTMSASSG